MWKNSEKYNKKIWNYITSSFSRKKYNSAICGLSALAFYNYSINQVFMDKEIENYILKLSNSLVKTEEIHSTSDSILFYDGFGLQNRGLIRIYIEAITKYYRVIYVTKKSKHKDISEIETIVCNSGGDIVFFDDSDYLTALKELDNTIKKYRPFRIFIYTTPFDIPAAIVFTSYNTIVRYMINLTDHAFWVGLNSFDYCIEFRNFGASITHKYRGVDSKKLIMLPFYPYIDDTKAFEGYPFKKGNKKVIFSGGALYKTMGGDSAYYTTIRAILDRLDDVVFWYAGTGDSTYLDNLIRDYPGRVYHTEERSDLFQLMKNIDVYYSTYPILGGLMLQYAAIARKIPLTLRGSHIGDDFLIGQNQLGIIFNNANDLINEMVMLLQDNEYRLNKEMMIRDSVISEIDFQTNLKMIIDTCVSEFRIEEYDVRPHDYQTDYLQYVCFGSFANAVAQRNNVTLIKAFPECFIYKIYRKMKGK